MLSQQPTEVTKLLSDGGRRPLSDHGSQSSMPAGPPRAANEDLSNTVEAAVPNTKAAPALIEGVEGLRSICCVLILAVHYQDYVSEHTKTPSEDMPLIQQLFWAVLKFRSPVL